jgi:hypothetical protein
MVAFKSKLTEKHHEIKSGSKEVEPRVVPPAGMTCANCEFYVTAKKMCFRYPPTVVSSGQAVWPVVLANDWCGEHSPV